MNCPTCGRRLRIPAAGAANQVRCPQCREIFAAPQVKNVAGGDGERWTVRTDDGREYGPVDKRELDQWYSEGRLNHYSELRPQAGGAWLPAAAMYPGLSSEGGAASLSRSPAARGGSVSGDPFRGPGGAVSHRSKLAAGLLGIFLGQFGVHRFYLGFVGIGLVQLLLTLATCGMTWIWGVIEGVLILAGAFDRDADGRLLRD